VLPVGDPCPAKTSKTLTSLQAASIPEGQNELKRNQLRELAALNGTLRDDENQACQNCGQIGHRKYDCPERQNYTASIICRVCGNAGHMARDCPDRQRGASWRNDGPGGMGGGRPAGRIGGGDVVDREYEVSVTLSSKFLSVLSGLWLTLAKQLMQEIGGGGGAAPARIEAGPGNGDSKPWQRGPSGGPAPWRRGNDRDNEGGGSGGAAPWARDRNSRSNDGQGGDYYNGQGNYGGSAPAPPGAAPWHQPPGAPPAGLPAFPGFPGYGAPPGMGAAPPGLPPPPGAAGLGAPPGISNGLNALIAQYSGAAPPPPPAGDAPPPPPSDLPPPPPPGA